MARSSNIPAKNEVIYNAFIIIIKDVNFIFVLSRAAGRYFIF